MADPVFKINTAATGTQAYLDYSSCSKKDKKFKFSEKDFRSVVSLKVTNKDNITATELKSIFTGLTDKQATYLIKTADTKGGKKGAKNDKLDWKELQVAIKTADEADKTFDGLVSFENFQNLVTDPTTVAQDNPKDENQDITGKKDGGDNAITETVATAPAADTNEHFFSLDHSTQGDAGLGGNGNLGWAVVGFIGLAAILGIGFGGGACRNNYYGYGGYC
ncbi:MAG: hypothetical protein QE263_00760 [Vampirovibrionales bacterium]|nr:hypothetical protein [Vampirovibrionales bacterium]